MEYFKYIIFLSVQDRHGVVLLRSISKSVFRQHVKHLLSNRICTQVL